MPIKRTTPGPNFGGVGSGKGAPSSIGTKGITKGLTSSTGGQYPFLPSPTSNKGSANRSPGSSASNDKEGISFLPKKPK